MQQNTGDRSDHMMPAEIDRVFSLLDGRRICDDANGWTATVEGIHADRTAFWVQVTPDGDALKSTVVRLPRHATEFDAIAALERVEFSSLRHMAISSLYVC
jgi:hypothetical protein